MLFAVLGILVVLGAVIFGFALLVEKEMKSWD